MKPYYQDKFATVYLGDSRNILPRLNLVDLVLCDPPYGIGEAAGKNKSRSKLAVAKDYGNKVWDNEPIPWEFMQKVIAHGKYAAVFGGNYYPVPPSPSWLVWDKENGAADFADCELVWTNYGCAIRIKRHMWSGMLRKDKEERYHPTQKPLGVVYWVLSLCPDNPQTICDPFMGSGTTLCAAKNMCKTVIGIDLEEHYCEIAAKRLAAGDTPENISIGKEIVKHVPKGFGF